MARKLELPIIQTNALADVRLPVELIDQIQAWAKRMLKDEKNAHTVELIMQTKLMSAVHCALVEVEYQRHSDIEPAPEEWFWRWPG